MCGGFAVTAELARRGFRSRLAVNCNPRFSFLPIRLRPILGEAEAEADAGPECRRQVKAGFPLSGKIPPAYLPAE